MTGVLLFAVCGSVALGADDDQSKKIALLPEQPRTMDQVIDRVTNHGDLFAPVLKLRQKLPASLA